MEVDGDVEDMVAPGNVDANSLVSGHAKGSPCIDKTRGNPAHTAGAGKTQLHFSRDKIGLCTRQSGTPLTSGIVHTACVT